MPHVPDKVFFKIGEASRIVGVKPFVLRYWETEFDLLKPGKAPSRHRLYKKSDVELLLEIKKLLYQEGYTIDGAKKKLQQARKDDARQLKLSIPDAKYKNALARLKKELESLRKMLS